MVIEDDAAGAFAVLASFLRDNDLTGHLAGTEAALLDARGSFVGETVAERRFTPELLAAALLVRARVGRLNDVIHASVIALVLPMILEPDEKVVNRPSLGAGNDKSRPYDLETDKRVAEFKVAQWKGKDAMRKRGVFGDLVHLALDASGRRAQLYTVGALPERFLRSSKATAGWAMGRLAQARGSVSRKRLAPPTRSASLSSPMAPPSMSNSSTSLPLSPVWPNNHGAARNPNVVIYRTLSVNGTRYIGKTLLYGVVAAGLRIL